MAVSRRISLVLSLVLTSVGACSKPAPPPAPADTASAAAPAASSAAPAASGSAAAPAGSADTPAKPGQLRIAYSYWPGWVAWEIAIQKGWFKEAGVDVAFKWFEYVPSM